MTTKELPSNYSGTTRLLVRHLDKFKRTVLDSKEAPHFYQLPTVKAPSIVNWRHEKDCADLYVSLYLTGQLKIWQYDNAMENGLRPDRISHIAGKMIFWEIDRSTEVHAKIKDKLPRYDELYQLHRDQIFYVIFTAPTKERAKNILLSDLTPVNRGFRYLVGVHNSIVNDPLGKVFVSPKDPARFLSFDELM